MPMRKRVLGVLSALALVMVGCHSPTSPSSSSTTFLAVASAPGDLIGNGFTQRVGLADAIFSAQVSPADFDDRWFTIDVRPIGGRLQWNWSLRVMMPSRQPLRPGTYEGAQRFADAAGAGLDFSGSGRGCGDLTGRFTIAELALGPGNTLDRLHMTFEQRCAGATAPLRGEISIAANPWR
jgi:hypothetical protein